MGKPQLTIQNQPISTPLLNFMNSALLTDAPAVRQHDDDAPISVYCEICPEKAHATQAALEAQGWGLYPGYDCGFSFCPFHESQI